MLAAFDTRTDTPHFPGIGRYARNLGGALARTAASADDIVLIGADTTAGGSRARVVPTAASPFGLRQQWAIPRLLRRVGAQLYHSPYYLMPFRPRLPCVVTIHDLIPLRFRQHFSVVQRAVYGVAVRCAVHTAQRIIAVSDATRRDLVALLQVDAGRIEVIPEGVGPLFTPAPRTAIAGLGARLGLPDRYALYVGSNKPHKNLPRLVEAWARGRPPIPLVVAGPWDPRFPQARQRGAALEATGRLRWIGRVPDADLPALYTGAACVVLPSEYEGFGLPVLEAMACGAPVACAHAGSLPEVVGDAAALFDPLDVHTIADTVAELLADDARRIALAQRGRARAALFTWDRAATHTWETYGRAAARR